MKLGNPSGIIDDMTTTKQKSNLGGRIRAIRLERGLSLNDVAYELRARHGRKVTPETLRFYEVKKPGEEDMDPILFAELADILDFKPADVSPLLHEKVAKARDLLVKIGNRCFVGIPVPSNDSAFLSDTGVPRHELSHSSARLAATTMTRAAA